MTRLLQPSSIAILQRLQKGPATTNELVAVQLSLRGCRTRHSMQRLPDLLSRNGLVEVVSQGWGRGNPNTWGLTPKGRAALAREAPEAPPRRRPPNSVFDLANH